MGLLYKATTNFTGANAAALPVANPVMPVPGAVRWFDGAALRAAPGTTISSWEDSTGTGGPLAATSGSPTVELVDGLKAVRFQSAIMQQSISLNQPHSLVLAYKLVSLPSTVVTIAGSMVTSGADAGFVQLNGVKEYYANAGAAWKFGTQATAGWHRMIVVFNGASSRVLFDGVSGTGNTGTLPRAMFSLGGYRDGSFSDIAVTHASLYSRALSVDEMGTLNSWLSTQVA